VPAPTASGAVNATASPATVAGVGAVPAPTGSGAANTPGPATLNLLAANENTSNVASYNTSTVTANGKRLLMLFVGDAYAAGVGADPTITGLGLTWTKVLNSIGNTRADGLWVAATADAPPTPGAITIDYGAQAQTGIAYIVVEVLADISVSALAAIKQARGGVSSGGVTSSTQDFDDPMDADNLAISGALLNNTDDIVPVSPAVELTEVSATAPGQQWEVSYVNGQKIIGFGWTWTVASSLRALIAEVIAQGQSVAGIGAVPAPTVKGNATASPVTVAGIGAVPAPTAQGNATASPNATAGVGDVPAATASGATPATASPATVAGVGSVPAPTASGASTASPNATAGTGTVPAPTVTGTATASPSATAGIGSVPPPSVTGGAAAAASPATVAGTGAIPAPTASGAATAAPTATAGTGTVPAATASGAATASPTATAGVGSVPSPVTTGAAVAAPVATAGTGAVPPPTAKGNATASPSATAGTGAVPPPTAFVSNNALPATVVGTGSVPLPTANGSAVAQPPTTAGTGTIPSGIDTGNAVALPGAVNGISTVAATATGAATASPATTAGTGSVPPASAVVSNTALPPTTAGVGAVPAPTARGTATAAPTATAGVGTVPAPTTTAAATASPVTTAGIGTVPAPSAQGGSVGTATPGPVAGVGSVPAPTTTGRAVAYPQDGRYSHIFKLGSWFEKPLPTNAPVHSRNTDYLLEFDGAYYGVETDGTPAADGGADTWAKTILTTTLVGSITAGATSMVVASSAGVPATPFRVKINTERNIIVTNVAGTTWTIVRFAGSASHTNGATVTVTHKTPAFTGTVDNHGQTTLDTPVLHATAGDTAVTIRPKALAQVFDSTWTGTGFFIPERFRPTGTSGVANQSGLDGTNEGIKIPAGADAFFDVAAGTSNDNPMMIEVPDAADPSTDGYWASFAEMRYYRQGGVVGGHTITALEAGWYAQGGLISKINSFGITSGTNDRTTAAPDAGWPEFLNTGDGSVTGLKPSVYQDDTENIGTRGNNAATRGIVYARLVANKLIPNVTEFFAERTRDDGTHVWPFDGGENGKGGLVPEGSRMHLKYSIDVDASVRANLPVGTSVNGAVVTQARQDQVKYILRGLQQYGLVVGDNSGSGGRIRTEAFQREPGSPTYAWEIYQGDLTFWPYVESWEFIADSYDPPLVSPVVGIGDVPGATAGVFVTASPATVAGTATIPAPTASGAAFAQPVAVTGTATVPAPTATATATAAPNATAGTGTVPAPTATGGVAGTASPTTVAGVGSTSATASGTAVASATTVAGSGSIPAPTATGAALAAPPATAGVGSVPAPTAVGTTSGTAAPSAVAGIGTIPAPTASGVALAQPSAVAGTGSVPPVTASGSATALPSDTHATGTVPAPSAVGGTASTALPSTVAGIGTVPAPTATGQVSATASPATVAGAGSVPPPTARGAATATSNVVAGSGDVLSPTVNGTSAAHPNVTVGTGSVPAPSGRGAGNVFPNVIAGTGTVPFPSAFSSNNAQPVTTAGFAAIPTVLVTANGLALPGVVIGIGTVPGNVIPPSDVWPQSSDGGWPSTTDAGWPQSEDSSWPSASDDGWPQTDDDEWMVRT
jgi:hypothetical protein